MLSLTRNTGDGNTIKIGDNITIIIQEIKGERVKIAIDAPKDMLILRGELENNKTK